VTEKSWQEIEEERLRNPLTHKNKMVLQEEGQRLNITKTESVGYNKIHYP
jgi:hypothetical protein